MTKSDSIYNIIVKIDLLIIGSNLVYFLRITGVYSRKRNFPLRGENIPLIKREKRQ